MRTIQLQLDDESAAALQTISAEQGKDQSTVASEIVRRFVETDRMRRALQDPALVTLYEQLAGEEQQLAEEGMADYERMLVAADRG